MASPTVSATQASTTGTTDITSWSPTMVARSAGMSLLFFLSVDQIPTALPDSTSLGNGWYYLEDDVNGSTVSGYIFRKDIAAGNSTDNLTLTFSSAQQGSGVMVAVDLGGAKFSDYVFGFSNGSGTNSSPPNIALSPSQDVLWFAVRCGDAAVNATARDATYSALITQSGGANGASIALCYKMVSADAAEGPAAFTSANEQWVAITFGIWTDTRSRWSQMRKSSQFTLSNSNLTIKQNAFNGSGCCAAVGLRRRNEKRYFTFTLSGSTPFTSLGLCAEPMLDTGTYADINGGIVWNSDGSVYASGSLVGTIMGFSAGDICAFASDGSTGDTWFKNLTAGSNWNNDALADPATGVGGINCAANAGAWIVPTNGGDSSGVNDEATFDGLPSSGVPSGFKTWDYFASSGYTLAAGAGPFVLSGGAASAKALRKLVANAALFVLAGGAAAFNVAGSTAKILVADAGAFVLTGAAAALRVARKLSAAQGSFSLAGGVAALKAARKLVAASGGFAFTGAAATLRATRKLLTVAVSFALTGGVVTFRRARRLLANAGAVVVTGNAAVLKAARKMAAAAASFALSGGLATFRRGKILFAAVSAYVVTGIAASLRRAGIVRAEAGSFGMSGAEAQFAVKHPFRWTPATLASGNWANTEASEEIWTEQAPGASLWEQE